MKSGEKRIEELCRLLDENKIGYLLTDFHGGKQVLVMDAAEMIASVVHHRGSYGYRYGLLEAWDYDQDKDPEGWLTAGEAYQYIVERLKDYEKNHQD